ncbi:Redoxin domain protein [Alkalidesulfovibrio alkalitolerans DSM 16529]|uniref:Redoxin domain protein n=1 Tax=Alkalidesulfovibrio alkalitolerans DSM 16529 TaxID=1121439 RepID=S7T2E3_9BACT|nr:TlpA disulfide reductase family protein [Alkalidesulfovibrio alkalitolerans]EPR30685.1 Redoxin domain protein [Alkalidesulfovibrio alkalitolerans DSM 16529]
MSPVIQTTRRCFTFVAALALAMFAMTAGSLAPSANAAELPKTGDTLPAFTMPGLDDTKEAAYLGVPAGKPFGLKDIKADFVIFEIIGVYCPQCHEQTPGMNDLFRRLRRAKLDGKVKMMALAAGGYPAEIAFLREQSAYLFPIVADQDYSVHKVLAEPQTPFTMIVDKKGVVHFAYLGIIRDIDGLFRTISEMADK